MKASASLSLLAGTTLVLTALTGCLNLKPASDPTRFYVLTARCAAPTNATTAATSEAPLLMLGWVEVADYLQRPEQAWRMAPNHVAYSHVDQWAEPLGDALARVLKEDLLRLLGPERFFTGLNPGERKTHEIQIDILRFDLKPTGEAQIEAHCRIVERRTHQLLKQQALAATQPFDPQNKDHTAAAVALSEALADLARQVAAMAQP
jgi:uncharacterized lipoprotein YmbA